MSKIVKVNHKVYGKVELNVERIIAISLEQHAIIFEYALWNLSEEDFDTVYKAWRGE